MSKLTETWTVHTYEFTGSPAERWLRSLPPSLMAELASLELAWRIDVTGLTGGVIQDWIEDHGEERGWWYNFYLERNPYQNAQDAPQKPASVRRSNP